MNDRPGWLALLRETARGWAEDDIPRHSAALAYYATFSLPPLLVIVLSLAGSIFGEKAVRGQINDQLEGLMGQRTAAVIESAIKSAGSGEHGWAAIVGFFVLAFGATSIFAEIKTTMNVIWRAPRRTGKGFVGVLGWLRARLVACGMVLGVFGLLAVSLLITAGFGAASRVLPADEGLVAEGWAWVSLGLSMAGEALLFALIFKVMPDVPTRWGNVWLGAWVTAVLFELGKWPVGWDLGRSAAMTSYGAAGSIAGVLLWVYYSSIILLTGAEFTRARAHLRRIPEGPAKHGVDDANP